MPLRQIATWLLLGMGILLTGLNLYGIAEPNDRREELGVTLSFHDALAQMDQTFTEQGASAASLAEMSATYASAIDYSWPTEWAAVPLSDNWILHLASYTDALFVSLGVSQVHNLFAEFQSLDYERGFRRGYGICSQNAIAFVDLIKRRYDIDAAVVGLNGHVVVEARTDNGARLVDPSLGLAFPLGFDDLGANIDPVITAYYTAAGYPELAMTYNLEGNSREPWGAQGYQPKVFLLERWADALKWPLPLLALLLGWLLARRST